MKDSRRLKVAVIGCGGIAQMMHLPYLQMLSDRFEIVALCDLSHGVQASWSPLPRARKTPISQLSGSLSGIEGASV